MDFNPRSREENDYWCGNYIHEDALFQSTFPRGERRCLRFYHIPVLDFNPRSREGNDYPCCIPFPHLRNFNPRSREGNDVFSSYSRQMVVISIHVPARGTTCSGHFSDFYLKNFNPRSREGNDDFTIRQSMVIRISIHVPARGTTQCIESICCVFDISIHVPARGTTLKMKPTGRTGIFQSTFPRGERHFLLQTIYR